MVEKMNYLKKKTLKDPFYFLDICSPSYCLRKKKFSKHTGANREIKKKTQQISVMKNQ